jgi:hypothetical protein
VFCVIVVCYDSQLSSLKHTRITWQQVKTNPHTGQVETKKKLGGAYPGQRRPHHNPYVPDASQFGSNGQATVHFKAYGGGTALTLVQQDGSNAPVSGAATPQYVQGTFSLLTSYFHCAILCMFVLKRLLTASLLL